MDISQADTIARINYDSMSLDVVVCYFQHGFPS